MLLHTVYLIHTFVCCLFDTYFCILFICSIILHVVYLTILLHTVYLIFCLHTAYFVLLHNAYCLNTVGSLT